MSHVAVEPCLLLVVFAELPEEVLNLTKVSTFGLHHSVERGERAFVVQSAFLHVCYYGVCLLLGELRLGICRSQLKFLVAVLGKWLVLRLRRGDLTWKADLEVLLLLRELLGVLLRW